MTDENAVVRGLVAAERETILKEWLAEISHGRTGTARERALTTSQADASDLLDAFEEGLKSSDGAAGFEQAAWRRTRELLAKLSRSGASRGDSAGEISRFVLAIKRPLFGTVQRHLSKDVSQLTATIWLVSSLVDKMAQHTATTFQQSREEVILRQQQELLELSTPVVKMWDGVLAVPMIGTLDSSRTQLVMESLLERIVETGSELAIIDITGVPTVDTLVAQHLLKTVTAIRLMGADCIISGVRPQIAQTIVHLGIDLQGITTKASLADALALALKLTGYVVTRKTL